MSPWSGRATDRVVPERCLNRKLRRKLRSESLAEVQDGKRSCGRAASRRVGSGMLARALLLSRARNDPETEDTTSFAATRRRGVADMQTACPSGVVCMPASCRARVTKHCQVAETRQM